MTVIFLPSIVNHGIDAVSVEAGASSPFATAIGGTSLFLKANHTIKFQTGWGINGTRIANPTPESANRSASFRWGSRAEAEAEPVFSGPNRLIRMHRPGRAFAMAAGHRDECRSTDWK